MNIYERMTEISKLIKKGIQDFTVISIASKYGNYPFNVAIPIVFDIVRSSIKYRSDAIGKDISSDVSRTIKLRYGDCEDQTILLGAILSKMGYDVKLKVVGHYPEQFSHIYPLIGRPKKNPTGWIPLDIASKLPLGVEPDWRVSEMVFAL